MKKRGLKHAIATSFGGISGNPRGKGPPKGQGGAPPQTMRDRMKLILQRNETVKAVEAVLADPDHKHFAHVLDTALDRAEGKVQQTVDLTSKGKELSGVVILPPTEPKTE